MKIMSNKTYNQIQNEKIGLKNSLESQEKGYSKMIEQYSDEIEQIYSELIEFKNLLNQTSSKKVMKSYIDKMIKKIGGKI